MQLSHKQKTQPIRFFDAYVPDVYQNVKVIIGSEEMIYDQKYVTAIVNNNRVCKFLKDSVKLK